AAYLFTSCGSTCPSVFAVAAHTGRSAAVETSASDSLALACAGGYCDDHDPCTTESCGFLGDSAALGVGCRYERDEGCESRACNDDTCRNEDQNACNGVESCQLCLGCLLQQWPCCGRSEKCVSG